jgi:NADH-quinone oxidoreductase subunit M
LGVILAAVYMLWMYQRVMFGELIHEANQHLQDLTRREVAILVPVVLVILWIGLYPQPFLQRMEASTRAIVDHVVTVASPGTPGTQEASCRGTGQLGAEAARQALHRGSRVSEVCREPRLLVPETEG